MNIILNKINFGCGTNLLEGYLNIDATEITDTGGGKYHFLKSSLLNPQELPNNFYTEIKAQMVFEHIHPDLIPSVIYTMSCLLKMNGAVHVTVPNYAYFAEQFTTLPIRLKDFTLKDLTKMREAMFQLLDPMIKVNDSTSYRGHQSFWTAAMACYWFESEGFTVGGINSTSPILTFTAIKQNNYSVAKDV